MGAMGAEALEGPKCPEVAESCVNKVLRPDGSKLLNGFKVGHCLGAGAFGKVRLVEEETSAEKFALKIFSKGRLRRQREFVNARNGKGGGNGLMVLRSSLDKVRDEIKIMKRLAHLNCIRLHAVFDSDVPEGKLYLLLEYAAGGPTMEWDEGRCSFFRPGVGGTCGEELARDYVRDGLSGLEYLHGCSIGHRDVKPQNLLVDARGRVKLADFGVAIEMGEDCLVRGTEGTYYFYAPEMCRTGYTGHDGRRADVWAAGVALWAFLFGTVPFVHRDLVQLLDSIGEGKYEVPDAPSTSDACRAFLRRMLQADAPGRPLCHELLAEPWCSPSREPSVPKATSPIPPHSGDV